MFNNNNDTVSSNVSHIGEGLQVEGDLICKGTIEISGIMNGNIKAYNIKSVSYTHLTLPTTVSV